MTAKCKCGNQFSARRSDAKTCPRCKATASALAMRAYPARCRRPSCGNSFYRVDRNEVYCVDCRLGGIGEALRLMEKPCSHCKRKGEPELYSGSVVCRRCVEKPTPGHADEITDLLFGMVNRRKQAALKREADTRAAKASKPDPVAEQERQRRKAEQAEIRKRKAEEAERCAAEERRRETEQQEILARHIEHEAAKLGMPVPRVKELYEQWGTWMDQRSDDTGMSFNDWLTSVEVTA